MTSGTMNTLLNRQEVVHVIKSRVNPGKVEASAVLSKEYKVDANCIAIRSIRSGFGEHEFLIEAHLYTKPEFKDRFEPRVKLKKEVAT